MAPAAPPQQHNFMLEAYWTCSDLETESRMKGMEKATRILGFEYEASSPHDQATGHTTGRVHCAPFKINKFVDKSSPLEVQSLVTNKMINEGKIAYYANKADGTGKIKQFEITLSKFVIVKVEQTASSDAAGVTEWLELTYDKIVMIDVPSTKQVEYEWTSALA